MSDNEVVVRSGRKLTVGSDLWEIRDGGVPVEYVDLITEARTVNGVAYVSLAAAIIDGNNDGIAQIATRIRMNMGTAQALHQLLGQMIKDSLTSPVDPSKAN